MGRLGDTDVYDELDKYGKATQTPGIKVYRFPAPLYYANVENFRSRLYKLCKIDPALLKKSASAASNKAFDEAQKADEKAPAQKSNDIEFVIIDCSGFSYVDLMGVNVLAEVYQQLNLAGIVIFYADCNGRRLSNIQKKQHFP